MSSSVPKSRTRRKPTRRQARQRHQEPAPRPENPSPSIWRKRVGWPLCFAGLGLFLAGNIGARTGIVILPFDPHHVIAQFGGAAVAIAGLVIATGD